MVDLEMTRAKWEKLGKGLFIVIALALTAPMAYMALEGAVLWGTLALLAFLAYNFSTPFGQWVAVKKIQAIELVASLNPIETMQDLYREKMEEYKDHDEAITDFDTEFQNVSALVEDLKKSDPEEAPQYALMRDKMKEGLLELREDQRIATEELEKFKHQIDKARRIYRVAQAMNKALEKSQSAQQQVFAEIREQVAFDTVRTNLNRAFANLNSAVERRKNSSISGAKAQEALPPAPDVEVIDITAKQVPAHVKR